MGPRSPRREMILGFLRALVVPFTLLAMPAYGGAPTPGVRAVPLFSIAKSENKNQVQYAVRVDEHCAPLPDTPIVAYWRMLEQGPSRMAPLLARELDAYGPVSQLTTAREADGGKVRLVLKAVPGRTILVETLRGSGGACQALSTVLINGAPAHLYNVYVKL